MKTIVRFEFDNQLFHKNYCGPYAIILENPPHIPQTGDPVDFNIADFFNDEKVLERYQRLIQSDLLYAHRIQTKYSIDVVEIMIVLYQESSFRAIFPQLFEVPHQFNIDLL
ncbi:hypothetical protein OQX63_05280 [Pedobacter sp. PF22-3]|uniref:hypothetical protein n=1 Tax=Pedobacter sp. PF22-3 TaxID=2994467 RepID=UPI0022467E4F|nr:hypothetical protein [Pedobacter sp. PF22-3]MCX2492873.1 hypothetical protein [Pedobacter sp. PF22-3]